MISVPARGCAVAQMTAAGCALLKDVSGILPAPTLLFQAFFTIAVINSTLVLVRKHLIRCMTCYVVRNVWEQRRYTIVIVAEQLELADDH